MLAAAAAPRHDGDGRLHHLTITASPEKPGGPLYLRVQAGDLNGDGTADDAVVELVCTAGKSAGAFICHRTARFGVAAWRPASAMYTPVKIVKEWGAASPQLSTMKPEYDVKMLEGQRARGDGWTAMTLSNTDGLCGAAESSAAAVVKSKSNITQQLRLSRRHGRWTR